MTEYINKLYDSLKLLFYNIKVLMIDNVSMVITIVTIVVFLYALFITLCYLLPLLWQFGKAMWKSKVAICANSDRYNEIKNSLQNSYAFQRKKIYHITPNCIDYDISEYSVIIIDWESLLQLDTNITIESHKNAIENGEKNNGSRIKSEAYILKMLNKRNSKETSIIIFSAPGKIPPELMGIISEYSQVTIVNAKGRLSNDVFLSLLTTKVRVK